MNYLEQVLSLTMKPTATTHRMRSLLRSLFILALPLLLAGCSGGDVAATASATTGGTPSSNVTSDGYVLYLEISKNSIKTDNLDSAEVTATLLKDNVAQPDATVTFSTTNGMLLTNTATTDANGEAMVTIRSGPGANNQVVSISAISNGATANIPLEITGNTIALTIPQPSMAQGTTQELTATLLNANAVGIGNATVTYTVIAGSGIITLAKTTDTTGVTGKSTITITGQTPGTATIVATGRGAISEEIDIIVADTANVFQITSPVTITDPATNLPLPTSLSTDSSLAITVNVPAPTTSVIFQTSIGTWQQNGLETIIVAAVDGEATATLTAATTGLADITVFAADNAAIKDTLEVNIFAPASQAASITLQASQDNVPTSPALSAKNGVTLTAIVRTAPSVEQPSGGVVGNAQIVFKLQFQPGGGEQVNPSLVTTDSSGTATTTFYSGTLATGGTGVRIIATVLGTGVSEYVDVVIRDQPGSVVIGLATTLINGADDTYYTQRISVQVADSNGNAVPDKDVYLKLWPTYYYYGFWAKNADDECQAFYTPWPAGTCDNPPYDANEDLNMSLGLDPLEDIGPMGIPDGHLTPPNSAAGSVPPFVTTDENGIATFDITYLKLYATWVEVRLTASTSVQMTENQTSLSWPLSILSSDADNCEDGGTFNSPFGFVISCLFPVAP